LNNFPNDSIIRNLELTTATSVIIPPRLTNNRRGFFIENAGNLPIIFALGSSVSANTRTAQLNPGKIYEDVLNWQGSIAIASLGGDGLVNFTELIHV